MTTAADVIQDALEKLSIYAPGEAATPPDLARGLTVLNDMLDSWSNDSLACYTILQQSLTFIPGQSSYTIGTTGTPDVMATRPLRIIDNAGVGLHCSIKRQSVSDGRDHAGRVEHARVTQHEQQLPGRICSTTRNIRSAC